MKFIKKHKYKLIIIVVFLLVMIFAILGIKELLYPNSHKDLYGNRLEGIDAVRINEDVVGKIKNDFMATGNIAKVDYNLKGRIVNFIVDVNPGVDLITAKSYGDQILNEFTEEQKKYYDFQLFITSNGEEASELYPIIGYKHKTSLTFVWSNR